MFEIGRTYTRDQIHEAPGGGKQEYLPHVDGRVVAGCFDRVLNPGAPEEILPGRGPRIERWAEVFAGQSTATPVFLKNATNKWQYVGEYCVTKRSLAPEDIQTHAIRSGRSDISQVLHLARS